MYNMEEELNKVIDQIIKNAKEHEEILNRMLTIISTRNNVRLIIAPP